MAINWLKKQFLGKARTVVVAPDVTSSVSLNDGEWPYKKADLEEIKTRLAFVAYKAAWKRPPKAETHQALLPFADFLIDRSGMFVKSPKGQAALTARQYRYEDGRWMKASIQLLKLIFCELPKELGVDHMGIEVHAWALSKSPTKLVKKVAGFMAEEGGPATGVMQTWQDSTILRMREVKGVELRHLPDLSTAFPAWRDRHATDLMDESFRGSPFKELLELWVPITIPDEATRTHIHGMGPTGCGKTTFNEATILKHIGKKGMVLFDTKGGMAARLIRHSGSAEHILEVNFDHEDQRPLFNLLQPAIGGKPNKVAKTLKFILAGFGVELTSLQEIVLELAVKIAVTVPNATISTLVKVLTNEGYAQRYVVNCSEDDQEWFASQYDSTRCQARRDELLTKLGAIKNAEEMNGLFNGDRNTLDIKTLLDSRKLVIFTINKEHFQEYTQIISRAVINSINAAMWKRDMPIGDQPLWIIFVDELRDVIGSLDDSLIEQIADQGRERGVCLHFTHQRLKQMSTAIQDAILNNASVNFYANIDPKEAKWLADRMGCKSTDMLNIRKDDTYLYFCLSIKGYAHASKSRIRWNHVKGRKALSEAAMGKQRDAHKAYWASVNGRSVQLSSGEKTPLRVIENPATIEGENIISLPWSE